MGSHVDVLKFIFKKCKPSNLEKKNKDSWKDDLAAAGESAGSDPGLQLSLAV